MLEYEAHFMLDRMIRGGLKYIIDSGRQILIDRREHLVSNATAAVSAEFPVKSCVLPCESFILYLLRFQ